MDRTLYTLPIPSDAQTESQQRLRRSTSEQGTVGESQPVAEGISLQPGERVLRGQYRGQYAGKLARELEELFDAGAIAAVPFYSASTDSRDGYYTLKNVGSGPVAPQEDDIAEFDGSLVRTGSRRTHWRSLQTAVVQVENDFGTTRTAYVGAPTAARNVRWVDRESKQQERPSPAASRAGEHATIDVYDADAAGFADPTLIYDVPYNDEWPVDPVVWDTRGNTSREDANGVLQWAHVYDPAHQYVGLPVVSNRLVRLEFDEAGNALSAEEWDDANSVWSSVSLGTSDWELYDLDIYRIGVERVEAQVEYRNPTTSPTSYYALDMLLHRGYQYPQWVRPQDESSATPSGLVTKLDPIADGSELHPQEEQGVLDRGEVRR